MTGKDILWLGAAMLTTLGAAFLAPALAQGGDMASRTVAQLYFFVVIAWISLMAAIVGAWPADGQVAPAILRGVRVVATCVFCLSVALEGNARLVRRERAAGTLSRWHQQQSLRMRTLRAASSAEERAVVLPPISEQSAVLPMVRNSADPDYAHNLCLEWYYQIPSVSTE